MFIVLSSWPRSLREFAWFIWWIQTEFECRVAASPQTKPIDLGCESTENWQLLSTSTITIVIITQPISWYSFYHPKMGGRLSRPRHCSKGAQPVPKAVYRSSCHDKHNRPRYDSNLGRFTPQLDTLTARPLRPAISRDMGTKTRVLMARMQHVMASASAMPPVTQHSSLSNCFCFCTIRNLSRQTDNSYYYFMSAFIAVPSRRLTATLSTRCSLCKPPSLTVTELCVVRPLLEDQGCIAKH